MSLATGQPRLPRFEGHLNLKQASLYDKLHATITSTGWSERWCSLEDGKLLVYKDRDSAMVHPDSPCLSVDVCRFICVQQSASSNTNVHQLVLSTTPIESTKTSRVFRTKSTSSFDGVADNLADSSLDQPRPRAISNARPSFQTQVPADSIPRTASTNTHANRSKTWSKLALGSRKLYNKISLAGHNTVKPGSKATPGPMISTSTSTTCAAHSSSSITSMAPAISTPDFPLGDAPQRLYIRASSQELLRSWLEALSRTIKVHAETACAPSLVIRAQNRTSQRPLLSNLPGFRTPPSSADSPVFPSLDQSAAFVAQDIMPKASRKRNSSSISIPFGLRRSLDIQRKSIDHVFRPPSRNRANLSEVSHGDHLTAEPSALTAYSQRPSTAGSSSSSASQYPPSAAKNPHRTRMHIRSISNASSSLTSSAGRTSLQQYSSLSVGRMLHSDGTETNDVSTPGSLIRDSTAGSQTARPTLRTSLQLEQALKDPSGDRETEECASAGKAAAGRHRRSLSLLRLGSARIMAWRDDFTPSESMPKVEQSAGPGLSAVENEQSACSLGAQGHSRSQSRSSTTFTSIKSFLNASNNQAKRDDAGPRPQTCAEPRASFDVSTPGSSSKQRPEQDKQKGVSRKSSLLSLTRHAFGSRRGKSGAKQSLDVPREESVISMTSQDSAVRIAPQDCEFSYELVSPTQVRSPKLLVSEAVEEVHTRLPAIASGDLSQSEEVIRSTNSSPLLVVERILPPEQMINTFDQLRAVDPTGRSCDWLSHIEHVSSRASLDARRPSLRPTASQTFDVREASPRLRSSLSAWDVSSSPRARVAQAAARTGLGLGDGARKPRVSDDASDKDSLSSGLVLGFGLGMGRSLPAPLRERKRRAKVSISESNAANTLGLPSPSPSPLASALELPAVDIGRAITPLGDVTNIGVAAREKEDLPNLDKLVMDETFHKQSASPRRRRGASLIISQA